jgi:3-keto-disaccharide hydrolase
MRLTVMLVLAIAAGAVGIHAQKPVKPNPPKGFTALFNGKDLTGWRGRQPNYDPAAEAKLTKEELATKQAAWNTERDAHWTVDTAKGEIVSDGKNPHLATAKDYGDFEFHVDWLMVSANGDSGIYLRGIPQVQIWDPSNPREVRNGAEKGSGALWNNTADNPGKFPLVKADNPIGEWNNLKIRMIGDKVWIWLNDKVTVDGQKLDNYFTPRGAEPTPIPERGPIELQTHNSEMRFRNIYIREIPAGKK